ncbi:MAG: pyruvate formate lyase family protein [Kiritimatiellae bacterium]|nr:pyruvate formate lyase family protein [Kiritimatiellia bacterium]
MTDTSRGWAGILEAGVERVRAAKRAQKRVDDWFFVQEIRMEEREAMIAEGRDPTEAAFQAELLCRVVRRMPLSLAEGAAIAGSQDGAFSPSYALINPAFEVESFAGYCDPTAVYDDIEPDPETGLYQSRIDAVRRYWEQTPYVRQLRAVYAERGDETGEVVYFVEPVTGHTIPDLRPFLANGVRAMQQKARDAGPAYGRAMADALEAAVCLADRYRELAVRRARDAADPGERARLETMADVLGRVPARPCRTLHEAVQAFALLWQVMVLEQAPNPYAISVGNLDRILLPYYDAGRTSREEAVALVRHLLAFFQVGNRCWAISQNVLAGGRDAQGADLTSALTWIVLDAFFASNDPQPALSVKVHAGTPESLYRALGRFFFTPGHSTPSLFSDDTLFEVLRRRGVAEADLPDYAVAGCQEPLVMGKSSVNTTNTWLNLAKVLELATHDGCSLLTGKRLGPSWAELGLDGGAEEAYADLERTFFAMLDRILPRMRDAGNACTDLLGTHRRVPFTSALMDGFASWRDMRDPEQPGVRYAGSGCLIHGLAVVANGLHAVTRTLQAGRYGADAIRDALRSDYGRAGPLRNFLECQDKFGNDKAGVDETAARLAKQVSEKVRALRNTAGNAYLPDWSTPSTHLLYGHWVGATPDGRKARRALGFGVDPVVGTAKQGLPGRLLSAWKLPFLAMTGGYASHIGLDPRNAPAGADLEAKGLWLRDRVIVPLFRLGQGVAEAPYYVYLNVDEAGHLREVLKHPQTYAPDGIYIVRIHGTFVNFLDLSPAIQRDIIERLDPLSTAVSTT